VSFQEKSAIAISGSLVLVYGAYKLITLRSERVGGYVLAVGVFIGLVLAMAEFPHFYIAHALLLAWVLAELTDNVLKVWRYRRGA
jgi:hypothetical protein